MMRPALDLTARRRWAIAAYVVVAAAWIVARVEVFSENRLIEFPDSASYLTKAEEPLLTSDFFVGSGRFFVVPLFYKMVLAIHGPDKTTLAVAQMLLSLCAWLTLGWSIAARFNRSWLSVAALAAVLAFGLSSEVIQWDVMILSESVSTSLFVLLVSMWIRLSEGVSNARVAGVIVVAAAWSLSREANSLLILPFAAAIVVWGLWYWRGHSREQMRCGILAGALVAIFVGTFAISGSGDRWVFPLLNVIGTRVLPSPDRTAFYQAGGMPVSARLMDLSGEFASGKGWAFYSDPELEGFRAWLRANGKRTFVKDLLTNPVRTLAEPVQNVDEFVCPVLSPYRYDPFTTFYPNLDRLWYCQPRPAGAIVAGSLVLGVVLLVAAFFLRRRLRPSDGFSLLTVAAMLVGWLPFTWFTWHVIGGMEIGRHVWSGVMMSRVGAFLLLMYLIQAAGRRRLPDLA